MPGSAVLDDSLVDSLVPVVDSLRGSLHPDMGVRHWRAYVVRRSWDGGEVGVGTSTDVTVEITPQPMVEWELVERLQPAGLEETGNCTLTEISLTYTEAELTGRPVGDGQEWFWSLVDAHGQQMAPRYFTIKKPPYPDRIKNLGWVVELLRVQVEDCEMTTFVIKEAQLAPLLRSQADAYPKAVQAGALKAAQRGRTLLVRTSPVDTGIYKNAWRVAGLGKGPFAGVMLMNDAPHAGIIELGARPHKVNREGIEALTQWVLRHIQVYGPRQAVSGPRRKGARSQPELSMSFTEKEARSIAFAIAKKIEKEGQKPTYHLQKNLPQLQNWFFEEVQKQVKRVVEKKLTSASESAGWAAAIAAAKASTP